MTKTYQITGMTCSSCEAKVKSALEEIKGVQSALVSKEKGIATITMSSQVHYKVLKNQLSELDEKYKLSIPREDETVKEKEQEQSWISTYKPVLLIFLYIFLVTGLIEISAYDFNPLRWMRHFMAGFFFTFSFFKLLNLKGFKESYIMYDILARKFPFWAYIYTFTELLLGIAFLINFNPILTNSITLLVMSVSIIGVLQTVLNKKSIRCACLGDVFNLPMSTVTIIEDGLMIIMSLVMLIYS